jgi:hypothetical protein
MARTKHALNFKPLVQAEVPHGRNSKHRTIVTKILSDLDRLTPAPPEGCRSLN